MPEIETEFKSDPASVRAARDFVAAALAVWELDDVREVAVLLTSELVTNAVRHARTAFALRASYDPHELLVEVRDGSSAPTATEPGSLDAPSGRGLSLVRALAARWGVRPEIAGKTVWFALAIPRAPT